MPIFEYECKKCGHHFEALVKNSDAKVKCEKCDSAKTERKLSRFAASVAGSTCEKASGCPSAARGACGCGCRH